MKTKLLTTLLLTTFFLTACGSNKTTTNQSSQDTTTGTTDTSTGGETTDASTDTTEPGEEIKIDQVFQDVVYSSNGVEDDESFPSGGTGTFEDNVLNTSKIATFYDKTVDYFLEKCSEIGTSIVDPDKEEEREDKQRTVVLEHLAHREC